MDQTTLFGILSKITGRNTAALSLEQSFKGDMGMDSLQALELVVILEEDYGICIEQTQATVLKTPKALLDYIAKMN